MKSKTLWGLVIGALGFAAPFVLELPGLTFSGSLSLSIFLLAAIFWILEPIPIYATSLGVILLQSLLLSQQGILAHALPDGIAPPYQHYLGNLAHPIIMLFLGGFSLASAAVKYGLDKSLTRALLTPFGDSPSRVCLGLMLCTATLSAFMSNTATTAMMMTVVLPIAGSLAKEDRFRIGIALAIPVAANIGGMATPIGTPPNAVALAALREQGIALTFTSWMALAAPFAIILLLISWRSLISVFKPRIERFEIRLDSQFNRSPKAIAFYAIFAVTLTLWITEKLHGIPTGLVALIPIAALPAFSILDRADIRGFSWEVLWLVAGGISLGVSMKDTGLAAWLVGLVSWDAFSGIALIIAFGLVGYTLSNLISNTVAITILMPLVLSVALASGNTTVAAIASVVVAIAVIVNSAMLLPISTPPNAIAMSSGMIATKDLAKVGAIVGFSGIFLALLFSQTYWPYLLNSLLENV